MENKIVCQFFILKQVSKTTHKLTIMTRKHTHAPIFTRSDATMWTFTNYTYQQGILAKNINSTEVINNCSLNKLYLSPSKYTRMFCGVGENWAFMLFFVAFYVTHKLHKCFTSSFFYVVFSSSLSTDNVLFTNNEICTKWYFRDDIETSLFCLFIWYFKDSVLNGLPNN